MVIALDEKGKILKLERVVPCMRQVASDTPICARKVVSRQGLKKVVPLLRKISNLSVATLARRLVFKYRLAQLLGKSSLTREQSSLLVEMRTHNSRTPSPFRATEHRQSVAQLFDHVFSLEGIGDAEEQYFNLRFSGFAPGDPRLHRYLVYTYFHLLRDRDVHGLLKRIPAIEPLKLGMAYEIDGCKISLDLLFSIDEFYSLLELRPDLMSGFYEARTCSGYKRGAWTLW